MEAEPSAAFLSLGMEALPAPPSSRCQPIDAKPLRSYSALAIASHRSVSSFTDQSILANKTLASASSLSLAMANKPTETPNPEAKKDSEDMGLSENEILLFGFRIKASDSDSSVATVDDRRFVQDQEPGKGSGTSQSIKGFRLFGIWIPKNEAYEKEKLGMQETSKTIKKRPYTRTRPVKKREARAEHAPGSYMPNIGELLAEKVLTKSDVDQSSRLLLSRELVDKRIVPILKENYAPEVEEHCKSLGGVGIQIYDADAGNGNAYTLVLKRWKTNSFVFTGKWKKEFVKRRNLKENDEVGLFWDQNQRRFNFSVKQIRT